MGHRLTKIYTRTGDEGTTGLGDGARLDKDDSRIEAIGTVDELNSVLGMLLECPLPETAVPVLVNIQHDLFDLGGELSLPGTPLVTDERVTILEEVLDEINWTLPPLKEFILPGGGSAAATCHLARAVCRRTERRLVTLNRTEPLNPASLRYINRLSDLLFVLARHIAREAGEGEVFWSRERD
jgi:cob(I)alamin adenosyltransferase